MSEGNGNGDGFLSRWSRRKRDRATGRAGAADAALGPLPRAGAAAAQEDDTFAGFDFDSLDFASDYRRFMASAVPDEVRSKALRKLWTSADIIAKADDLDDYLEDFREEAMALPAEMVRSAYRIGRGFVEDDEAEIGVAADEACEPVEVRMDLPQVPSGCEDATQADSGTAPLEETEKLPRGGDERHT